MESCDLHKLLDFKLHFYLMGRRKARFLNICFRECSANFSLTKVILIDHRTVQYSLSNDGTQVSKIVPDSPTHPRKKHCTASDGTFLLCADQSQGRALDR